MANIKLTTETIKREVRDGSLTPYMVHVMLNERLAERKIDRVLIPQHLYNYSRNGLIVKGSKRKGPEARYTFAETEAFITRWMDKNYPNQVEVEKENDEVEGQQELEFEV